MSDPFYITTAIHYPNGRPHIGHAYEMIAADAIARFQRQAGRDVFFQTGTDEHGLKMVKTARDRGVEVRDLADEMSGYFRDMVGILNISCDRFIRTVEPQHYAASQAIWTAMRDAGDLYLDRYEGWYSVRDEAFYEEKELTDGEGGVRLSPQGTPVEWTAEETWFFRLSNYQQPLLDFYAANPDFIQPESRRNEVLRFVEGGLTDLSVSRTSFDWGVPIPDSPGHVMYVWVDALTNYLTGAGYPDAPNHYWPAALHLIGKDIVRFHAVYWPAFLMSAKLPLPHKVFGHGFLLNRGEKMSKSTGNVVDPIKLAELYGVDALRYFLLRDISFGQDGTFSDEAIVARANSDLANSFGNLAQRTLSFIAKNLEGALPDEGRGDPADAALLTAVGEAIDGYRSAFAELALGQALEAWMRGVFACNQYIDVQAPWALRKTDPERMHAVLGTLVRAIRDLAIAIEPVVPASAAALLAQLGQSGRGHEALGDHGWYGEQQGAGFRIAPPTPIFPRLALAEVEPA
ncbi:MULTISPECIES: methionine--tRNA ligase [Sphingomonas]|jgi:methionyl-tRNA synthetase|uniref:Methionine--tRNA ligase n=1 Tax=Sphingomonas hankookensis TaxID=563996 RepID=A0ABR5YH17_9SPHN|nr:MULTISPECIES: methionine--tRNA ligase [Sphingomonas]KZE18934.1 methionine--tRNA ligase [Sphingomonas hankookensis]PZT93285.1 MAG: methionine--tRNA ligase [Sphingomonas sp.]RSV32505.1 methionine--tRNA ligase [Sphingomonas sp. ABOLH]WCP70855.1 methionine--tRNA ligase [Sphingomonas hankookensis]